MALKTVKSNGEEPNDKKKLSYEDLEKFAYQLSEQAKVMKKTIDDRNEVIKRLQTQISELGNTFTRMQFLLEVVKNSNVKFNESFAMSCAEEFESLMKIPEQNEDKADGVQAD